MDDLIRELIRSERKATAREVAQIVEHIATASFDTRVLPVQRWYQGLAYLGRVLGTRESALFRHLVVRVRHDRQWAEGTTEQEYLADIRQAVRDSSARVVIYERRGGHNVGIFAQNVAPKSHMGVEAQPFIYVVYSADRGTIITGYQVSSLQALSIPANAQWLK
jgi:hypothetical protein